MFQIAIEFGFFPSDQTRPGPPHQLNSNKVTNYSNYRLSQKKLHGSIGVVRSMLYSLAFTYCA